MAVPEAQEVLGAGGGDTDSGDDGDAKEKRRELWGVMVRLMGRNRDLGVKGMLRRGNRDWGMGLLTTETLLRERLGAEDRGGRTGLWRW